LSDEAMSPLKTSLNC